ncbi:acyl-CoA dehydrogenase family member 11-like isoform X2 [Acanthaster planci]|uniref:Acyl-CoA dehydrogenase family member 11-like isoform X2 n=1 Tax=Acanthaster planci TaxID=133434 RepID=A0A8B7ZKP0_ACAPL|nr:acyl-CoA dehydrogenase family member 11-like isoform X2 [Acanthaster planci]
MTEKRGGSDVADGTETVAVKQTDGSFKLYGFKWFSSATDSDIALTLARIVDKDGNYTQGTKGISLFYVETRNKYDQLNGIQIQKLKNKLGTRQLPTAELLLDGTVAQLVSDEGRGVAAISSMLTVTRIHNAISSAGAMRRVVHLARDYSQKRHAFGKLIASHPLHMQTLSRMEVETRGNLLLVLRLCHLLGIEECGDATEQDKLLLRLLTPVAKLYTAKQAISIASEGLESFGGQGYIEDTGLPVILRDAQVLSIWEGTTNILSLDVLRSIAKTSGGSLTSFFSDIQSRLIPLVTSSDLDIRWCYEQINKACREISSFVDLSNKQSLMPVAARDFANSLARTYIASLLLEHASWDKAKELDIAVARRWCEQCLCPVAANSVSGAYTPEGLHKDTQIVMDGYNQSKV